MESRQVLREAGGGEAESAGAAGGMQELLRTRDWSQTPLGPREAWPATLRTALSIVLGSGVPMMLLWGDRFIQLYNDAFAALLGSCHPACLGESAPDCWPEGWEGFGAQILEVYRSGEPYWANDRLVMLHRPGAYEESYFNKSFAAIRDERGQVGGVLMTLTETTAQVVELRRNNALLTLGKRLGEVRTRELAYKLATRTLAECAHDVVFAMIYAHGASDGSQILAELQAGDGIEIGGEACPPSIVLGPEAVAAPGWPLGQVRWERAARLVELDERWFGAPARSLWHDAATHAVILPLVHSTRHQVQGYLIVGLNPRRPYDAAFERFVHRAAEKLQTALENAHIYATLNEQHHVLAVLHRVNTLLGGELELDALIQAVTDAGTRLCGADYGAFFYNGNQAEGENYTLYTLSGATPDQFRGLPSLPVSTALFRSTFEGEGAVRMDDVHADPRYGLQPPYYGLPPGHPPVRSYLGVPVVSRAGEVYGGLFFAHAERGMFTERDEQLIVGLAAQAAIAIDNARLYQAVRQSEERFRAVIENTVDLVLIADTRGQILYASPSVEQMLGYEATAFCTRSLDDYACGDDRALIREQLAQLAAQPEAVASFSCVMTHGDGSERHLDWQAKNLLDNGGVSGLLLSARDVTALKQFEAELIDARDKAEEMTRLKSSLLANMSHEIRTPLTSMIGWAAMLAQEVGPEHLEAVRIIERSGRRLAETLNSVLTLAQLEAGGISVNLEPADIVAQIRDVVQALEPLARDKGLALEVHVGKGAARSCVACVDLTLLHRIFNNLIGNALKFTDRGHVRVHVDAVDDRVEIVVEDSGIGIDAAFLPHLFSEFKQESTGLSRSHEGSGLGLAISRRLVEKLGGTITVASTKGVGTRFTVGFERDTTPQLTVAPFDPTGYEDLSEPSYAVCEDDRHRVLIVEDNDHIREVVTLFLGRNYTVEAFAAAEPGIERAGEVRFNVIFLDISLPGMDGVEAVRKLRQIRNYRRSPIIAMTGHALPGDREAMLRAGFSDYISKPFTPSDLAELIGKHLDFEQM